MDQEQKNNKNLYQCSECCLHYKDEEIAKKCEIWCKENKTCNTEITKHSEETSFTNSMESVNEKKDVEKEKEKVNDLDSRLEECKKKGEEYLNNWKRAQADFENYKRNEAEKASMLIYYARASLVLNLLPILDSIYLAEKHSDILKDVKMSEGASEWFKGFDQIKRQIEEFLKREGIEEIETAGKSFNPETMEAVDETEVDPALIKATEDAIAEELQKGYIMNGKVLRPARVRIAK